MLTNFAACMSKDLFIYYMFIDNKYKDLLYNIRERKREREGRNNFF